MKKKEIKKPKCFEPQKWVKRIKENCYMYAINYQGNNPVCNPGIFSNWSKSDEEDKDFFTTEELIQRIYDDIRIKGGTVRETTFEETAQKGEWKIAAFEKNDIKDYDFHFMREDSKGQWSHKFAFFDPRIIDGKKQIIKDPRKAKLIGGYKFVKFLMVKESL